MASTTVYLPFSTWVNVRCVTNAAFQQRATLVEQNGTQHQATGSGEHDAPMQNGTFVIQTPSSGSSPNGYTVAVSVDTNQNGAWQPSAVLQGGAQVMYYNVKMVTSEDSIDNDWNDTVVFFTWYTPPS
jgi:hypothetical protein